MADNPNVPPGVPRPDLPPVNIADSLRLALQEAQTDESITEKLSSIRARYAADAGLALTLGDLGESEFDKNQLLTLLVTAANGENELPAQNVTVQYLRLDQKLLLPAGLGLNPINAASSESRTNAIIAARYSRVISTSYATLRNIVLGSQNHDAIREAIDALPIPATIEWRNTWIATNTMEVRQGVPDSNDGILFILATLSQAIQLNCDVRDVGFLSTVGARVSDSAWADISEVPANRLNSKLKPYTMQMIAALNLSAVARNALAAWVRAYGVSAGVLPTADSSTQKEYSFTYAFPTTESRQEIINYEARAQIDVYAVCMNIIAMFGLLHLGKDHTFKSGDANMERICVSWVMTLRTMMPTEVMEYMKGNLEPICRTAAHPFGLGQTYWLARVMHRYDLLASPLMIRIDASPPPVQRVMIVRTAVREWAIMAAGHIMNDLYGQHILAIQNEYTRILAAPPSFSGLYRLYGLDSGAKMSPQAVEACSLLMPIVYGYSMAMHVDDTNKKDGLALALSLNNVERDNKVLAKSFHAIWSTYLDGVAKTGLADFVVDSARLTGIELSRGM